MRRIIPVLLLLSVMIAVFAVPRAQLHAAVLPPVKGDSHFGVVEAYEAPQLALNAGVRWQRIQFWWREFQPKGPGDWNANALGPNGSIVKEAQAQGFEVAGLLINTPEWAAANGSNSSTSLPKNLYSAWDAKENYWGQYVRQVVDRYRSVNYWIIWNEPDIRPDDANNFYFTFQGSEADYAQLLKVAYLNAKAVRPDVKIVMAGMTYWTDKQYNRRQYFDRLLETIAKDPDAARNNFYFDVANIHLYVNPTQLYSVPNEFRSDMAKYGLNKPVWVGETNVMPFDDPAVPGDHTRGDMRVTLDEQASFTIQAIAYALAAGVERFAFYKMVDTKGDVISGQALLRMDYTPRPEYSAYQVAALYFSNATKVTYQS